MHNKILSFSAALNLAAAIVYRDDIDDVNRYKQDPSQWPFTFPYQYDSSDEDWICAATMISPRHAITAAHCFDGVPDNWSVVINNKTYTVIETRLNPCYDLSSMEPVSADMAILVLDRDVDEETGFVDIYDIDPETG